MAKRGPYTTYKPEYSSLARKFCLLGVGRAELAQMFEVADSTIDKWIADFPEFSTAVKAGRAVADADVAERLYARALGYSHPAVKIFQSGGEPLEVPYTEHYPPDTQALLFWLRNRRRQDWREKVEHEHGGVADMLAELDAASERARNARRG